MADKSVKEAIFPVKFKICAFVPVAFVQNKSVALNNPAETLVKFALEANKLVEVASPTVKFVNKEVPLTYKFEDKFKFVK